MILDVLFVGVLLTGYFAVTYHFPHEGGSIQTVTTALIALWQIARNRNLI